VAPDAPRCEPRAGATGLRPLIAGDLRLDDELMHHVTDDRSFNESMMFNFFDARAGIGGFVRIGNRLNEGHAEMTFCVFLPGGELLMQWGRPAIHANDRFDAAGMTFRVVEPGRQLVVDYDGDVVRIANPDEMREPGKAMRGNPACRVRLHLDITAAGPMIGDREGRPGSVIFLDGVGHYQQPIAASGTLAIGGEAWNLQMYGARDHSWGRRVWSSIFRDRSIWITFGPELAFICCKTWLERAGPPDVMGCVVEDGEVTPFRAIHIESRFRRDTFYHEAVRLELEDVRGRRYSLAGEVLAYVPLRHRKEGQETVFLGQAMTRFSMHGREVLGLSEYFDAESACPALLDLSRRGLVAHE
jgi:hypothetical protein